LYKTDNDFKDNTDNKNKNGGGQEKKVYLAETKELTKE
jgi:hypothetical protein